MPKPRKPPSAVPIERVRGEHPDESWRADALAGSRHTRWIDELREPLENHDLEAAKTVCAEVCRGVLRDFAPGLILLAPAERARVQALATYAFTLFDFARQTGVEGERMAAINRWEFALDATLHGEPPGQPAFVLLAASHAARPWSESALDAIAAEARSRAIQRRSPTAASHAAAAERLAGAIAEALFEETPATEVREHFGAVLRLHGVLSLGEGVRRHAPALPGDALDSAWRDLPQPEEHLGAAMTSELADVAATLRDPTSIARAVPRPFRRAVYYAALAAGELLERARAGGLSVLEEAPELRPGRRIALLARSRFTRLGGPRRGDRLPVVRDP